MTGEERLPILKEAFYRFTMKENGVVSKFYSKIGPISLESMDALESLMFFCFVGGGNFQLRELEELSKNSDVKMESR